MLLRKRIEMHKNTPLNVTICAMTKVSSLPIEISFEDSLQSKEAIVIDCRTIEEYENGHLKESVHLPLQHLSIRIDDFPYQRDEYIYVYCRIGNRSETFALYLRSLGFLNCQSIAGGYELWGNPTC